LRRGFTLGGGLGSLLVTLFLAGPWLEPASSAGDVDCSDFANQAAAQSYFLSHGGPSSDPAGLDADGDGVACESLPCPYSGPSNPGGGQKPGSPNCRRPGHDIRITFSKSDYPKIISHIKYS
jgi:Excalibur calcium-binding domain